VETSFDYDKIKVKIKGRGHRWTQIKTD